MATQADVRKIALSLPGAREAEGRFAFSVENALLRSDADKFFTEPHYDGFPAVLVRLAAVNKTELRALLVEAWRCQAPASLVAELA